MLLASNADSGNTSSHTIDIAIDIAKEAWTVVRCTHPQQFRDANPFVGLTRFLNTKTLQHASQADCAWSNSETNRSLSAIAKRC